MSPNPAVLTWPRPVAGGGGSSVLAHDVFDCNTSHTLAQHVTAGHPLVGSFVGSHVFKIGPTADSLYMDSNGIYAARVLADVGVTNCTVSAQIIGRALSGTTATDRHYGIGLGLPAPASANGIGGLMYYLGYNGTLTGGQITSGWNPPTGFRASGITITDDMLMSVTLDGLDVTVTIDGIDVYTTTLSTAPTGTHAGAGMSRVQWNENVGYKYLKVESL